MKSTRLELRNHIGGKIGILGGEGAPIDYHLRFAYYFSKKISLQARVGNNLHVNFHGWEFGIEGKYLFYKPLFISAGLLEHSNEGGSGSISWGTAYATIFMLHAGIGIEATSNFSIEFGYYKATSKKVIGGAIDEITKEIYVDIFEYMFRLSFIFGWDI